MKRCTVNDCERDHLAKGLCLTHYQRLRRWGSLEKHKVPAPVTLELVLRRGRVDMSGDCWLWGSTLNSAGYGCIGVGGTAGRGRTGKVWLSHRLVYTLTVGDIPAGLILHHECETPRCVNPAHLVSMSRADHERHHLPRKGTGRRLEEVAA